MKTWEVLFFDFEQYIRLEKRLSENTVSAYMNDLKKLVEFSESNNFPYPVLLMANHIQDFIQFLSSDKSRRSQSRILSGLRLFFVFLQVEKYREDNPMELLENPKLNFYLPDVLSLEDINKMVAGIDLTTTLGERNKAIIEALYGLGLRVSELTELKLSDFFWEEEFVKVTGKGNKQRLVPLGAITAKYLRLYIKHIRDELLNIQNNTEIVFLNRRGKKLSRVMIFNIIKESARNAGIEKKVSPHTLRHSFATHLIQNGADLISIQKMLGHESITTTEIYTHLDQNFLTETMDKYHPRSSKNKGYK